MTTGALGRLLSVVAGVTLLVVAGSTTRALAQVPVPRPFPGASRPQPSAPPPAEPDQPRDPAPSTPPAAPAVTPPPAVAVPAEPTDAELNGAPVYPSAEFLESYDAGRGQRYYLYGTNVPYVDIIGYYRTVLRDGGREIFEEPPVRQFELGRFDDDTMAFPPSVTVKDYGWNGGAGYLFASGATERRFRTIIQIVPAR